jgi:transposase
VEHSRKKFKAKDGDGLNFTFVLGRKAWLFSDTPAGAHASAAIYSLVETAKANDIEPYQYLRHVFEMLPLASTAEDVAVLLPWHLSLN